MSTGTDREDVQAMTAGNWPVTRDGIWKLHWHIPRTKRSEPRLSVVVTEIRRDPPRFNVLAMSRQVEQADYRDIGVGEVVELAGKRWQVEEIDTGRMDVPWKDPAFEAGSVSLRLLDAAG